MSEHKTRVNKMVNLYSYLRFCGNIICTAGPTDNFRLPEATGMDTNGCDMPNDSNFALQLGSRGCHRSAWGQHEELEIL